METSDVLKTIGCAYLGGKGYVAYMINSPEISREYINQYVFYPKNEGVFFLDLIDIKQYLCRIAIRPRKKDFPRIKSGH